MTTLDGVIIFVLGLIIGMLVDEWIRRMIP